MEALAADIATIFGLSEDGAIAFENEPGQPPGPRLFLAGCREGNRVVLRHDVGDDTARAIAALVARERPWFDPQTDPACLEDILARLGREAPVESVSRSLIYRLPHALPHDPAVRMVRGDTAEGVAWLAHLAETGMPQHLLDAGFLGPGDFWDPWVVALEGDDIAAMAFAARIGSRAAETGVYTFPGYRGRGLAAAVTAAWSGLAGLADRPLFYSTQTTNLSSQRVAARLGLPVFGAGVRVT
ncbi:GNAT family N-acetyltransferase [Phenylobacterium sp.]|uniref:GNAT family N-acetyltransferase n=1 Tax=Phenylobacterium sp. TaxID=1871053 RepID=UPI0030F3A815